MSGVRVGFIGAGKMATALARGIVSQGRILQNSAHLMASCPVQDSLLLEPIKELGGKIYRYVQPKLLISQFM